MEDGYGRGKSYILANNMTRGCFNTIFSENVLNFITIFLRCAKIKL